jgi:hypothetical protein
VQGQRQLTAGGGEMRPHVGTDILERLQYQAYGTGAALTAGLVR